MHGVLNVPRVEANKQTKKDHGSFLKKAISRNRLQNIAYLRALETPVHVGFGIKVKFFSPLGFNKKTAIHSLMCENSLGLFGPSIFDVKFAHIQTIDFKKKKRVFQARGAWHQNQGALAF